MTIEFDDLIPSNNSSIEFDDLIPKGPSFTDQLATGVRSLFGNVVTPFNAPQKIGQLADTFNPPEPTGSVFDRVPVEPAPFNFAQASAVQRAINDNLERQAQFGTIGPITGPKPTVGSVASGVLSDLVAGGKAARGGINQMAGDLTGSQYLLDKARRETAQAELMRAVNTPNFETETARGIYSGLSSTVRQLPSIAAAIATRNPNIALGGMVAPMVPEEYGKFRQRGADPLPALAGAAGSAATEYITEKLPMGFLVQQFGRAGAGQFLTGLLAREVPGEQLATLVQDAIDTAIANPDKTWGDYLAERPSAAYQTLLATITQTGIMGGANTLANRLQQQQAPEPTPADYQDAVRRVFGRTTPPAPAPEPAPQPAPEVVSRILQAIEQTQNVQNVPPAARTETQAAPVEAPAPAAGNATAPTGVPAEPATPDVEAAGLTFDDLVPATTEAAPAVTPTQPVDGAITNDGTMPDVSLTNEGKTPILQNRNRATPSSIAQMQSIATQPDYGRLGFSRDFANGAPVVAGGQIAPEQLGRQDVAVASDGRRIPVQYAVVEAADVLPSNQADGTPNPDYGNQAVQRIRAIAGNGRIAGLQLAYRKGTTPGYLQELTGDTLHGVNPDVIRAMRAPVLVRVMPADQVTADIGDVSNTVGNLNLSAVEQANNDAQRVDLDALQFAEDGSITPEAVRQFVRAMPQAEQGGLIDTNGQPTKQAVDRINAAVFAKAYGNEQLIRLFAQAQDPEARNVLSALAQVAPKMARLEGAGALDIRGVVTQAAEIAVNARREGKALSLAAQQLDLAADPAVGVVLDLFARNARSVKPVVEALSRAADFAYTEANKPGQDMFGEVPRASRADVINQLSPQDERASQETLENPAGRQPVGQDAGWQTPEPARPAAPAEAEAGRPAETEGLNDDWMTALFGDQPDQPAAQTPTFTPRRDPAALSEVLANAKREAEAARDDWTGRKYKQNRTQVELRGDGPSRQDSKSVSAINEGRRQKNIEALNQEIAAIERMERMLASEQSANRLLDILNRTMEQAELAVQNRTAVVGNTPAEAFEYQILQRLDIKPAQGAFTSNRVSKALLAYLQGEQQATAQQETATEPLLTAPTADEVVARQEAAEAAQREREAADRRAAEVEAQRQEREEIRRRSEAAADTFELGQDPMDNLTGQGDIFSAPAEAEAQAEDGITIKPGKGLIKGKFLAEVDGDGVPGGPWDTEQQARAAAEAWKQTTAERATQNVAERDRRDRIAEKFRNGEGVTNAEIESLGLKAGTSDMRWFMSTAANLFGLNSRDIRPIVKDMIRTSLTDMGAKREFVPTRQALEAVARRANFLAASAPAEPEAPPDQAEPAPRTPGRIDDFGEKLGGARKDRAPSLSAELTDEDIATKPFSQIWPAAEIDGIENKFAAGVAYAARAEVPAKPRVAYKVARWVEKVKSVRELARMIVDGDITPPEFMERLRQNRSLNAFADKVELLGAIDRTQWSRIGNVEAFPDAYRMEDGRPIKTPFTRVEIDGKNHNIPAGGVMAAIDRVDELLASETEAKKMQFEIRQNTRTKEVFINKKGDKEYRKLKTFQDAKEARAYIKDNYDDLVAAWEAVKESDNVKKSDVRSEVNRPRTGTDRRSGQDVTPEQFISAFGFRGVEFGNWVGQGANAKERQGMLNQAYDALMDLAEIAGIPPRAISLNGSMGLAFGSRGSGKAAAHFEPGNLVINLTKTKGAGSLAHEWFHALDNYFARQRGGEVPMQRGVNAQEAYRTNNYITYRPEPLYIHKTKSSTPITKAKLQRYHEQNPKAEYYNPENWQVDPRHPNGVRPEVERAFAELVEALDNSPMAQRAASLDKGPNGYWSRIIERGARSFENYVITKMMEKGYQNDYLANVRPVDEFPRSRERYPYLLPEEVAPIEEAFDNLFGTLQTKETEQGVALFEPDAAYNAEAPRRKYTDDRQLQLFLDNGPDRSQAGPRGEAAQREAVAAVDDLRSTETILGLALSRDYAARQRVSLVGQQVSSTEDLAVLAQVYRDPRFETFRVVFVNDAGKVVSQVGLTSRLPASTQAIIGNDVDAYLTELSATARNRGATGYYLLHNHPSSIAKASMADITLTQTFAQKMPMLDFKSHVVIDTNEYVVIDRNGRTETLQKDFGQPAPYRAQEWADVAFNGPSDVMAMAKRLQVDKGAITLIHTDNQYRVKAISTIPGSLATMDKQALQKQLIKATLKTGGSQVFAVGRDARALRAVSPLVRDAIEVRSDGTVYAMSEEGRGGSTPFPETRRTRVSPDTSPEFAYLRQRAWPMPTQRVAEPGMDQTQTPEFRRWFGNSQVVGAQGRPLVVYHGTAADVTFFDKLALGESTKAQSARRGFFFAASPKVASGYAMLSETRPALRNAVLRNAAQSDVLPPDLKQMLLDASEQFSVDDMRDSVWIDQAGGGVSGANVLPVYLSIQNPMVVDYGGKNYRERKFADVIAEAKAAGHDGVVFRNAEDSAHKAYSEVTDIFVAFEPTQIKSAIGNQGTFDPTDRSIVREEGAEYSPEPPQNPNRDALGRLKFRLGEVALHKLDAVTRPLQERFGMRMASPELRKQLRQMKATIEEAKRAAVNVAKEMNAMTEADRAMVSDIVEKMIAPGVVPPEHAVKVADAITRTMDQQTDELVELGMLSPESADRWRGRYLPRIYNRQTELADDPLIKRLFKTGTPTMAGIGGGSLKGRGLFQDVSVDAVDQWLAMGYEVRDPHWRLNQGKLELVDPNAPKAAREQVTVWRDWTPSERAQMGENRDAMYRFVQGYTAMQRDIAMGRLFNNIANNPEWVRRSGAEGWVQVPNTEIPDTGGVKRYGKLAGLWVRRDVMSHLTQFEEAANDTLQLYREALGLWKEGKTALNPVAHFNNVMANVSMAHFAGVSYWDGHKYVNAARDLVNDAPMVEEARKVGLFTGSFTKEEMVQNMPPELQKLMNQEEGMTRRAGKQVMNALTFWLRKPLRDAYEFEDTFFKYLIYRDARQQGMAPAEAMDYALRYIFTYDDLPSGARKVRDYAIPFFSWTYKAIPALLHTAMVYPWRFMAPAAVLHGINLVAYALAAGDEDDNWLEQIAKGRELEEEEREALPERNQGLSMLGNPKTIRLGTDSVTGNPIFLDASRVIPGGDMFDMVNQAGGLALPAPLMPNHPVLSAFSAMIVNREMFFGRDITDRNDTSAEAAEKRAKWMAGFLLPAVSPGGYHSQRILDATANAMDTVITTPLGEFTGVDRSGQPVQPKFAAMQTIGIKARPIDLDLEAQRKRAQEAALINSIAAEVRSMARLYQRGAVSDEMMQRTREKAREKIERIREED